MTPLAARWICLGWLLMVCGQAAAIELIQEALPPLPDPVGVAGPFVGVDGDAVIVAGGANFAPPVWEAEKAWHDRIWVLLTSGVKDTPRWVEGGRLARPLAYGASASTSHGLVCVGGNDATTTCAEAFLLRWNAESQRVDRLPLPPLPQPSAYGCAAAIGDTVYLAAGTPSTTLADAEARFWSLDVSRPLGSSAESSGLAWEELPVWPGPPRAFGILVAQHNGESDCVYLISGRREEDDGEVALLRDVYEFSPARHREGRREAWRSRADAPRCVMAGTGVSLGQSHLLILGGDDGSLFGQADVLRDDHPRWAM